MIAEQHFYFGTLFEYNQYATVHHQVGHYMLRVLWGGLQDVNHLNGAIHLHVLGHVNQQSVLCQHGVECCNGILTSLSQLGVVLAHQLRVIAHRADHNAFR